jgi:hypothetical protein
MRVNLEIRALRMRTSFKSILAALIPASPRAEVEKNSAENMGNSLRVQSKQFLHTEELHIFWVEGTLVVFENTFENNQPSSGADVSADVN